MIPIEWLVGNASDIQLEAFALSRQNSAANLRKEIKAMQAEVESLEVEARVALVIRDARPEIMRSVGRHLERVEDVRERESAA